MNLILEFIGLLSTGLAIYGVWLNNNKKIMCFYIWLISNFLTLCIHLYLNVWTLSIRDIIFLLLAIDGIKRWKNNK